MPSSLQPMCWPPLENNAHSLSQEYLTTSSILNVVASASRNVNRDPFISANPFLGISGNGHWAAKAAAARESIE